MNLKSQWLKLRKIWPLSIEQGVKIFQKIENGTTNSVEIQMLRDRFVHDIIITQFYIFSQQ